MCDYCEKHKPIMENENSVLFISAGRLILQDKTKPVLKSNIRKERNDEEVVCYESKWILLESCPMCKRNF